MKKNAFLLPLFFYSVLTFSQGWKKVLASDSLLVVSMSSDTKGGYYIFGLYHCINTNSCHRLIRVDANGNKIWSRDYTNFQPTNYGGLYLYQSPDSLPLLYGHISPSEETHLLKLDENGNVLWRKDLPLWTGGIKTTNKEIVLIAPSRLGGNTIMRFDANGEVISQTYPQTIPTEGFIIESDGITSINAFNETVFRMDFSGQIKWSFKIGRDVLFNGGFIQIVKTKDSSYIISNLNKLIKLDSKGNLIWNKDSPLPIATHILDDDGGLVCISNIHTYVNGIFKNGLFKLNKNGNLIWSREYETPIESSLNHLIKTPSGGYFIVGNFNFYKVLLLKVNDEGYIYTNFLQGIVINDLDKNCKQSTDDILCKNCLVEANNSNGEIFKASTNEFGHYYINLDTSSYTIKPYPLTTNSYWQNCTPSVSVILNSIKTNDTLNFFLRPLITSPVMEVNTSTPFLRRCAQNIYTVRYCNKGTIKTDNAFVVVTLDSLMEYVISNIPLTSRSGQKYRFNVGKVEADDCGKFDITTLVRCGDSTRLGQTLCVEARIFPDTVATINFLWSGANLEVTGSCQKDTVIFQVKNTGRAASAIRTAYVIENDVYRFKREIQLPLNGVFTEKIKGNGNTWRMTVDQEPNHPTSTNPTAFVEFCGGLGASLRDRTDPTQFANDDKALSVDIDCQPIIGSFDPNDKKGYPTGYGKPHYIPQNQDIEYMIRFQNTGTDTAFTVVIRDTITEKLDISTIEYGVASHPFKPEIYGKNILKFTFDNLNLVDSFKNEPKSHGFIKFRIKQKKDLPFGTVINNHAGIYFDFNDPVLTDTTLHTVGVKEVISAVIEKSTPDFKVKVSPNPITETAVFEAPRSISGIFELYDMTGKILRHEKYEGKIHEFQRKDLPSGIYIFRISTERGPLSIGKIVVP
jgi:hypothetical protein